ncbi:ABC transporter ATP-binding protein [Geobacter argillaceus]|uniref:Lipopolysaccharide transport system ATP-binding protein n=1 Tax=Geobacter argillaceus TaxID=345631 RepID=A0A562VNP8_9BACT|nr:polysaccharide ABC transporter ATP-binding protein [Geobacter argillaceus]TWJ19374.1 lipopolysaccharide transport system ATP-binding protein [Geobacter argillaceus]
MDPVISVENLSKQYVIGHRQGEQGGSLRELISAGAGRIARSLLNPLAHRSSERTTELFQALHGVSFQVAQGERIGIIGRNGAGKSTLLKLLSRITEPSGGRIAIRGRVSSLLEVGTGFHPELTGRENIYLNGAILGMSRAEIRRKFDAIVDFAEIDRFLDTPVKRYSSGMYVRLAFAVAAHLEPEILIVDEVLAVGDAQFQKKCFGKMDEIGQEGRTVLFVSHNMTAVRSLCSRALLLHQGALVLDDDVTTAIDGYLGGSCEQVHRREWSEEPAAPQNSSALLRRIAACDRNGVPLETITTDTELQIEIVFAVKNEGASIGLTLIVHDTDNSCVFSSINNSEPNWYGAPMPVGTYRSVCIIPGRLLNNRRYTVTVNLFGKSFTDLVTVREALRLEVLDGVAVRRDYFGEYGGYLRPDLEWSTARV